MPHIKKRKIYSSKPKEYPNEGHRKRLKEKFLRSGLIGFHDYEIIELLLTLGTPRKDCKQVAKQAIKEFSSLQEVLNAPVEDLQTINGIGASNVFGLKLFQAISERLAKEKIQEKIKLDLPQDTANYLQKLIGKEKKEYFSVLLLDSKNNLIKIVNISIGTLNSSPVHPREVFEPAIRNSAANIIITHNHPSGCSEPSIDDVKITESLIKAGKIVGIGIRDHIIVSKKNYFSFREKGLLD